MRLSRAIETALSRSLWIALVSGLILLSGPRVIRELSAGSAAVAGADQSTDAYFNYTLHLPEGTTRFSNLLRHIPPTQPIAIVTLKDDDEADCASFLIAYLSWPRPLTTRYLATGETVSASPPETTTFYVGVPPPAGPSTIFGSLVHVVFRPQP